MLRNNVSSSISDSRSLIKPDPMLPIPISIVVASMLIAYPIRRHGIFGVPNL
jgi:hypothetical protein